MASGRRAVVLVAMVALAAVLEGLWLAPASLLDARIAGATGQTVRLVDPTGSVWSGRGILVAAPARIPVAWEVDVWSLLRGTVRAQIRSDSGATIPRATIAANANGVTLSDVDVTIPAGVFVALLGSAGPGSIAGDVTAMTDDLDLTPGARRGEARLVWRGARVTPVGGVLGAVQLDLGEVRSMLKADGDEVSGPVANMGGDLALRGDWKFDAAGVTLALLVTPRRADQAALTQALAAIGTPDGDGWRVNWRVPLR